MNQLLTDKILLKLISGLRLPATIFALTLASIVYVAQAHAAETSAASSRIGFVDIPYLIDRAPQALEAEQRLETEFAPRQRELEVQRTALAELVARLADVTLELSEAEYAQLDRESRSLERRIKRSEQDFREELNIQKNNEFKNVRILVLEAIAQFGEQQDYDLIVSDGVLYANKRVDVTERILDSLVKEFTRLQSAN
ncbi:MAG: OmpH family outer membrane protein [Granulosicoccus sp.]